MTIKVSGYASVFGNVDSYGEVVDAGAFTDWIRANPSKQVPLLWMHESHSLPIGMTTGLTEDSVGLRFDGEVSDTALGSDVLALMESGAVKSASFAYRINDQYLQDDIWHLSGLELLEVSAVTTNFGANPKAFIETASPEGKSIVHPAPELSAAEISAIFAKHFRED